MFDWEFVGKTDVGCVREINEDCIHTNPDINFAILADGMGGHKGGEIASAMAVTTIADTLTNSAISSDTDNDPGEQSQAIASLLEQAITKANIDVFIAAQETEQYQGMGTTIVTTVIDDNLLSFAHVGDSRLYRFRQQKLEQLTSDHSLVNELLAQGYYKSQEEADAAKQKNVITRAVGIGDSVDVDTSHVEVEVDDLFLLCSDGLSDMISDKIIEETLVSNSDLASCITQLIDLAKDAGGRDNISVILAKAGKSSLIKKSLKWLFKN